MSPISDEFESVENNKWVWIRIRTGTKNRLMRLGKKGQTYDDVIKILLDEEIK